MRFQKLLIIAALFGSTFVSAQSKKINPQLEDEWLIAINGDTITAGDFWYAFVKNADEEKPINLDSLKKYKKLYDKFLLKVTEAKSLGYDTTPKFLKEFKGYKNQLAESYLKDKSVTDKLIQEAFDRSRIDVEASHILVKVPYDAMPEDTLKAFEKALSIMNKANNGVDFTLLAKKYSDDNGGKNGGYLGYFSVLRMVYPFENMAYNTKPGEISKPFRSRFGYHIIKVHSNRKAVGEVKVAHIMTIAKEGMDPKKLVDAEKNIREIYEMVKEGKNFAELARKFSEDLNTSNRGGELPWFGPNKFLPEFENAAFSLANNGDVSEPVKTPYGWHIIKRIDRKELASYDDMKNELRNKVSRSDRAALSKTVVINRIKKEYEFIEYRSGIDNFYTFCDTTLITAKWKAPADKELTDKMFDFAGVTYTQKEFAEYLAQTLVPKKGGSFQRIVQYSYENWMTDIIESHEKSLLTTKYPDYGRLLREYKDGIILFDLTSEKVWNKSVVDTAGLRAFHNDIKDQWQWNERMDGVVYKCIDEATAVAVRKLLKKGRGDDVILENINVDSKLNVRVEAGVYEAKSRPELNGLKFKKGVSKVLNQNGNFIVLKVDKVLPVESKSLSEVKGMVTAKYQDYLMDVWLKELREKYEIVYNDDVFKQLAP